MAAWKLATALLCSYGFFKEMRPSEPFLTPYLHTVKNFTNEEINNEVYPIWTYSYLGALVLVFLLTDLLRYKPVIVIEAITYIGTWVLLIWGQGVQTMQLMQFVYGFATALEIAYYSYIYAVVSPEHYRKVTSYTRSAILMGDFIAAVLGQILVSLHVSTYDTLNYISLASVSVAFFISVFLPPAKKSVYFHRRKTSESAHTVSSSGDEISDEKRGNENVKTMQESVSDVDASVERSVHRNESLQGSDDTNRVQDETDNFWGIEEHTNSDIVRTRTYVDEDTEVITIDVYSKPKGKFEVQRPECCTKCCESFSGLWTDFKTCYSSSHLLKWSIWWAFATCGNFLVGNYVQTLWESIQPSEKDDTNVYNGAVEAAATLAGALAAFVLAFIKFNWTIFGELTLGIVSIMDAAVLVVMGMTNNIWFAYSFYVLFRASYQFLITIASFQIASHLTTERYALVFGCNTFLALALQAILTVVVIDKHGLDLPPHTQFQVFSGYFFVIGVVFLVKAIYTLTKTGWRISCLQRWDTMETDEANCEEKYLEEDMEKSESRSSDHEHDFGSSMNSQQSNDNVVGPSPSNSDKRPLVI
ncbi:thiamine transporter 2-like [Glandiceps talaboti]